MKSWTKTQIKDHEIAARKLGLIKDEVATFISNKSCNIYEMDVIDFIKSMYKKHNLINDDKKQFAICAFNINTKEIHYFAKNKGLKLNQNSLILIDIWARLSKNNAPYADMTWMFFVKSKDNNQNSEVKARNKRFEEYKKIWNTLRQSRDKAIQYIQKEIRKGRIPKGLDIDRVAHDIIGYAGLARGIKHTVGHSLGFDSPHGKIPGINWREYSPILKNVGYTIEPGIYLEDFGMRTEIDFYVNNNNGVIITTPLQKFIEIIK